MAKKRVRKRAQNEAARVNVLRPKEDATGYLVVRHVLLEEAFRKIAHREWRAIWYETGELAGVMLSPPQRRRCELVRIRCGSVECLKSWILGASMGRAKVAKQKSQVASFLKARVDLFDVDREKKLRQVSVELALRKIDLGYWKPIWGEAGELVGVAAA